jgi:hypothetical protein
MMSISPFKCFATGCTILLFIGTFHLIGHFWPPSFENPTEIQLMTLMKSYPKKIVGGYMTMMDIQNGLSLCYSLFFLSAGTFNLIAYRKDPVDWRLLKTLSLFNALVFSLVFIVAIIYFFWIPVVSSLLAAMAFIFARLNFKD